MYKHDIESVIQEVKNSAIEVYGQVGPFSDDVYYEACLCKEMHNHGLSFLRLKSLPAFYKNERIEDTSMKIHILVEDILLVEIDSMDIPHASGESYANDLFRLSRKNTFLQINFSVSSSSQMFKRVNKSF